MNDLGKDVEPVTLGDGAGTSRARKGEASLSLPLIILRIGLLFFLAESLVMLGMLAWKPDIPDILAAILDATMATLLAGPLAYLWVVRPYYEAKAAPQKRAVEEWRHVAEDLKASGETFRAICSTAQDAIVAVDDDATVIYWNESAEELFGYTAEEVTGKFRITEIIPDEYREQFQRGFARFRETGEGPAVGAIKRFNAVDRNGREFPIEHSLSAVRLDGRWFGISMIRDVSRRVAAEEGLNRLAHYNELILDAAGEGIYGLDTEGRTTFVNAAAAHMVGWEAADLIGKRLHDIIHHTRPDGTPYPAEDCPNYAAFKDGATHQVREELFWRKDGTSFPVSYVSTPIIEDDGSLVGAVVVFKDISERKKAEEDVKRERDFSRSVIDSLPGVFYLIGEDGRFKLWNANFEEVSGYSAAEVGAITAMDFFEGDEKDFVVKKMREVMVRGEAVVDATIVTKDGRRLPYHLTGRRCDVSGAPCIIGMGIDISEHLEMEEALKASNQELEQFAYVASHDLQEPLRMITSYNQLLSKRYGDQLEGDAKEFLAFSVEGARRMQRLIRDLLDYSRVGRMGRPFEATDLGRVMEEVEANLAARIADQNARLTWGDLPTLQADTSQISRLLQNLVGNALKYSPPDRTPEVTVTARRSKDFWEVAVSDNGIGIPPDQSSRIFLIFQRLHGRGEYEGTGIGLAICQRIVDRHGGRIWVESSPGEGSIFRFTLPVKQRQPS